MTDLVKLYNPANASALSSVDMEGLQKLTSPEIKELAIAYPNMTMQRAYLLIIDGTKPPEKQLATLSTFENLWNLREKNAQKQYVAYAFKGNYKPRVSASVHTKKTEVLDLSETELLSLPGFKTATKEPHLQYPPGVKDPMEVKVTKVHKELIAETTPITNEAKSKPAAKKSTKTKLK